MKRTLSLSLLLVSTLLVFTAAKCGKEKYEYSEESAIEIVKTACFGSCPVYNFSIQGNGVAKFNGRRFVDLEGQYSRVFPPDTTNFIFSTFVEANLDQYQSEYTENVTDLPTTYLTFRNEGKSKKIKMYYGYPEELKMLAAKLEELAFSSGWTKEGGTDK